MASSVSSSVIIPTFNVAPFIERTLSTVFYQKLPGLEVICVDDGSEDVSLDRLKELKDRSPFPFKIYKCRAKGASSARNLGWRHSRGRWVQFLDADDLLDPEKIRLQIERGEKAQADIVIGDYKYRKGNGKEEEVRSSVEMPWYRLMVSDLGVTSSTLWKRSLLEKIGGWEEKLKSSQEYELLFRGMKQGAVLHHVSQAHTIKVDHGEKSISGRDISGKWKRFLELRFRILNEIKEREGIKKEEFHHCCQAYFDALRMAFPYLEEADFSYYKLALPEGFVPFITSTTSKEYLFLYRIFGLKKTEKLKSLLKRNKGF